MPLTNKIVCSQCGQEDLLPFSSVPELMRKDFLCLSCKETKKAKKPKNPLIGRKIADIRPMTQNEMNAEGWGQNPRSAVVIVLDDGTKLYPSMDYEGNGPGRLFGHGKEGRFYFFNGQIHEEGL